MKNLIALFAGLFLMTIAIENANAQTSASASAETSAYIVKPISITKDVDLVFGNIVPTAAPGTVVIDTDGNRTFTGGAFSFANSTGNPTAAEFTVFGEDNATYSITLSATSFVVKNADEVEMTVENIVTTPTPTGVLNGGTQVIKVGAKLNVAANQAGGLYSSSDALEITVAYN
jgi:hypothetical protein